MRIALRMLGCVLCASGFASAQGGTEHQQQYPNIAGEVVFENDRVLVQKFVLQPGEWEGIHSHSGNQLGIELSDGETTVRYGDDETIFIGQVGAAGWQRAVTLDVRHEAGNTDDTPFEWFWVNVKPSPAGPAGAETDHRHHYPNIAGEDVFENDRVLVQKFVLQPGEWEGIHSHSGNQLYVMLSEGETTVRYGDDERISPSFLGQVGWQSAVDITEAHESGNTGDTPVGWLWVNFKE